MAEKYDVYGMADAEFHKLTGTTHSENEMQNAAEFINNLDLSNIDFSKVSAEDLERFGISKD